MKLTLHPHTAIRESLLHMVSFTYFSMRRGNESPYPSEPLLQPPHPRAVLIGGANMDHMAKDHGEGEGAGGGRAPSYVEREA
jgi:hypothetical protein